MACSTKDSPKDSRESEGQTLFFFGSLMDPDVLKIVLGHPLDQKQLIPGTLEGYRCERETKESYPILAPHPAGKASILIALNLSQEDIDRILFYETDEYDLVTFSVNDGHKQFNAYGFATGETINSSGETWHLNVWQKTGKVDFLPLAERFMAGYGKMSIPEALLYWDELVEEFEGSDIINDASKAVV